MRMVREWRHLKMLKRAGRGHEPGGVAATKAGEVCVSCPACPHPDENLPPGWKDTPNELKLRFLNVTKWNEDSSLIHGENRQKRLRRVFLPNAWESSIVIEYTNISNEDTRFGRLAPYHFNFECRASRQVTKVYLSLYSNFPDFYSDVRSSFLLKNFMTYSSYTLLT